MNYKEYSAKKSIADKIANGEKLTANEKCLAYEMAVANAPYGRHNGYMGRRYKDF